MNECVNFLEMKNIPYEVICEEQIYIYEDLNVSEIAVALSKRNCIINDFRKEEESLENYYMNLIGGGENV